MAGLDVGFITGDPMLSDRFRVKRRVETIDESGRASTSDSLTPWTRGVITAADPADLMRRDDGQMAPRAIEVNARFAFRGAAQGFQPDVIVWRGVEYLVKQVFPFSNFGKGHMRVHAESTATLDPPTT